MSVKFIYFNATQALSFPMCHTYTRTVLFQYNHFKGLPTSSPLPIVLLYWDFTLTCGQYLIWTQYPLLCIPSFAYILSLPLLVVQQLLTIISLFTCPLVPDCLLGLLKALQMLLDEYM